MWCRSFTCVASFFSPYSLIAVLCLLLCELSTVAVLASATNQPQTRQLEIGLGIGAVRFPDYPGADEHRMLILPFPYITYHSRYLDVNRDKVRGKLLSGKHLSLEVDFAGSVAVDSSRDHERQGMPSLDWIGEVGPALRYHAWTNNAGTNHVSLVLPTRVAIGAHALTCITEAKYSNRGWNWNMTKWTLITG
jgi:hypothetical protein